MDHWGLAWAQDPLSSPLPLTSPIPPALQDVKAGKARVMKCLMENMAQPNFGEECKEELQKREEVMKSDYRFDFGVASNCQVRCGREG